MLSKTFRFALVSLIITLIQLQGLSQTSDTSKVILSKKDALKVLAKGYEAKALEAQRDLLLNQVDTLKARISIKEMQIKTINGKVSDLNSIISSKNKIISTQTEQRKILEKNTAALNLQIKKLKRKNRWTAIAGLFTTGLVTYLFISK